ncbi:mevalonate kinase [Haloarcula sp. CBA1130]|uniref:mevalonate kinase n=1 Tax=unclassified Haloarcula TaxID=2624677 RepID=UPI001244364A|nr:MULTISPECIES: mevalonate kinase [unclassified Haloarcula]KAA9398669.1 mevalonate kinase [Haloarcula sp. CBA1129]KAA9403186.1 mevalonate kinase [Haloarcula sp. CBA1130]
MVTSSAPGKVYLFGEHAVVYGEPAVPCAIERRVHVTATEIDQGLRIHTNDLQLDGFTVEYSGDGESHPDVDVAESLVEAGMGYVNEAVAQARDAADAPEAGFEISVEGDIPLGAGLGSSAALVVAAIDAATRELGVELPASDIADRAYQVEHAVQDGQASRADTFCSAMGGAVRVEGDDCRRLDGIDTLPFVIGYDGGAGDTGALVAGVRDLREEYDFAADTVAAIGDIVREGETVLETGDYERLGDLMDFNHGLLSALGVSSRSLDSMVWAARDADAHGAKLTGAGGGGCIVALDETDDALTALKYTPGCENVFRAELDTDGVRQE